ncbi:hypothetical protein NFHSH190041_31410 [Shewanella sp. NFH-SH190041]|uniref:hypothetical protein n=1 Tax=Shewanella sp. NFH-SH190041 TaxID=2950245 RepID=UPI0021C305A0|nr:hypothetical protein [Shewanella sp. NFH-SH190041]BDM65689.1 hypothetical protein NFHSH190041_31410 [Shewanella sp. NFH-SH190041]
MPAIHVDSVTTDEGTYRFDGNWNGTNLTILAIDKLTPDGWETMDLNNDEIQGQLQYLASEFIDYLQAHSNIKPLI